MKKYGRYKNPNLSNHERFIAPDKESLLWGRQYLKIASMPKGIMRDITLARHLGLTKRDFFFHDIYRFISKFTLDGYSDDEVSDRMTYLTGKYPNKFKYIKRVGQDSFDMMLSSGMQINGARLSSLSPELYRDFPDLTTDKRKGQCHEWSMMILPSLESEKACIATAAIWDLSKKNTILHSWIEDEHNGEEFVYDFTLNVRMNKEAYYAMMHVKEVFERIGKEQLSADLQILSRAVKIDPEIDAKLYLSSRDEALERAVNVLIENKRAEQSVPPQM